MTEGDAFLRAICEEPDEDTPRLAYADWLDEHGDHDLAEFIRVQIALSQIHDDDPARTQLVEREAVLLNLNRERWTEQVQHVLGGYVDATGNSLAWCYPSNTTLERGFVHGLWLELTALLVYGEQLVREIPTFRAVRLTRFRDRFRELAYCPALAHLHDLQLLNYSGFGLTTSADLQVLGASPYVGHLRRLSIPDNPIGDAGVAALADSPNLAGLRELFLPRIEIGPLGALALANSSHLTQLNRLSFWQGNIGPEAATALLESPNVKHLSVLKLERCGIGEAGGLALARSPYLRNLTALHLTENGLTDTAVQALAASPNLSRVRTLDLSANRLGPASVVALAESPYVAGLTTLKLGGTRLDAVAVAAIIQSPYLAGLTKLWLHGNGLQGDSLRALWDKFRDRVYL